jgi:hypothetical protein
VEPEKKKKTNEEKNKNETGEDVEIKAKDSLDATTYYMTGGFVHSYRYFSDSSVFQSLGDKYNEEPINTYAIGVGTYIPLNKSVKLEIGISYVLQGEQYTYRDSLTDSTFHYVNKYRHFGVPLRLNYSLGQGDFKVLFVGGVVPSSILSIRYESDYTNSLGSATINKTISTTKNLNSFVLTGSVGVGATYQKGNLGFILLPEYRYNFMNSYINYPVNHNLWSWGVNIGILLNI